MDKDKREFIEHWEPIIEKCILVNNQLRINAFLKSGRTPQDKRKILVYMLRIGEIDPDEYLDLNKRVI